MYEYSYKYSHCSLVAQPITSVAPLCVSLLLGSRGSGFGERVIIVDCVEMGERQSLMETISLFASTRFATEYRCELFVVPKLGVRMGTAISSSLGWVVVADRVYTLC